MITVEVNQSGIEYQGFTDISAGKSLDDLVGVFSFTATSTEEQNFPIVNGDFVVVSVRENGKSYPIITGYVDQFSASYSVGEDGTANHTISVQGRDKAADLIDSTLYEAIEVEGATSLTKIIEQVIALIGADKTKNPILVINNAGADADFTQASIVSSEPAQNAWDFILSFARKLQLIITTNGNGDIVITRTPEQPINTILLNEVGNIENNVKAATVTYADQKRYGKYIFISSQSGAVLNFGGEPTKETATNNNAEFVDDVIRPTRILAQTAETSMDSTKCLERAKWECNIRKAQARNYQCTVAGHTHADGPWMVGLQIKVSDQLSNISEKDSLLSKTVQWTYNIEQGSTTQITLTDKEAYSLKIEGEKPTATTGKSGGTPEWRDPPKRSDT